MERGVELQERKKPYNIRHRCYFFSKEVMRFASGCRHERLYSSLLYQLIRSATSIGANLVEGRAGSSKKDWINYFAIALKSGSETKYWLCLIRDTMNVSKPKINELIKEADEITKIIASIIVNTQKGP